MRLRSNSELPKGSNLTNPAYSPGRKVIELKKPGTFVALSWIPLPDYSALDKQAQYLPDWLKPHGIKSRSVRIGDHTPKGYRREDFADAWSRYIPSFNATTQHPDSELESADNGLMVTANVAEVADRGGGVSA